MQGVIGGGCVHPKVFDPAWIARASVASCGLRVLAPPLVSLLLLMTQAHAQPLTIPLQYYNVNSGSLGITIGINGGAPQPYLFDTGSNLFNVLYNPATWGGGGPTAPNSTVPRGQNQFYCYGSQPCYQGNIVQMPTLSFYAAGAAAAAVPAVTLSATQGYQISAVFQSVNSNNNTITQRFPDWYDGTRPPPLYGTFYGIFGTGNFASTSTAQATPGGPQTDGPIVGGVFGQTIVPGALHQGFVVAANGQPNPATFNANGESDRRVINPPTGNQIVTIGGQQQQVSPCLSCVLVGLTPALIGQFVAVSPSSTAGVVPFARVGPDFPNPYGAGTANKGSQEYGTRFTLTLPQGSSTISETALALLDTGTPYFGLSNRMSSGSTSDGSVLSIVGVTPSDATIPGLATSNSTLGPTISGGYSVSFSSGDPVIGLPFFLQNSVMFDLTGQTTGYTPFYVTAADLATTANGPLIVGASNLPLGLAGVISGAGGVTVGSGGMVQMSGTNTYSGVTTIGAASGGSAAGLLLVSGPGSIASSAGVVNNGVFDISRAWAAVAIQTLSGSGQVFLGAGNLVLNNASGTYSGTISDGGSYPVSGGSLTLAGGSFTLAGTGNYSGGTYVTGGAFTLSGTLLGGLAVAPGGSFTVAPGGLLNDMGVGTVNAGQMTVSGTMVSNVANFGSLFVNGQLTGSVGSVGILGGTGSIAGNVASAGITAPGNSIGTLGISGNFTNATSGAYSAEVSGTGQGDLINVGGTATLLGGSVNVYAQPGTTFGARTTWRILNAAGGVSGTFASVNELYPFLQSSLSYDANNVYLTLEMGGFAAAAATPTQAAVGNVLDASVNAATGDFANVLSAMATGVQSNASAQYVLQQLSGNNYAGFASAMVQGAQLFMNNFAGTAGGGSPGGSGGGGRVALAEACNVACDSVPPATWGAWGGALGGLGTIGATASVGAVTYNAGGFAAGLDRALTESVRLGVTAGYTKGTQWVSGFAGQGTTDTFNVGLYGNYAQGPLYADALVGYAYSSNQMWRQILIPGLQPRTAFGLTGANQWYGQLEAGWRFDIGTNANAFVTPFARLQAYTGTQNAFTETGAQSLNLTVAQQTTNSLRSVLGATLGGSVDLGWREKLALQLKLGWSHEYGDVSRPVAATLAGAPAIAVHDLRHLADARRRAAGPGRQHRHRRGDLDLPAL